MCTTPDEMALRAAFYRENCENVHRERPEAAAAYPSGAAGATTEPRR